MAYYGDYMRARYAAQRAKGECGYHKGVPALPGKSVCARCRDRSQRGHRAHRQFAVQHGRCVNNLGHQALPGRTFCAVCLAKASAAVQRSKQKARQQKGN